jgi:hypothetical protein
MRLAAGMLAPFSRRIDVQFDYQHPHSAPLAVSGPGLRILGAQSARSTCAVSKWLNRCLTCRPDVASMSPPPPRTANPAPPRSPSSESTRAPGGASGGSSTVGLPAPPQQQYVAPRVSRLGHAPADHNGGFTSPFDVQSAARRSLQRAAPTPLPQPPPLPVPPPPQRAASAPSDASSSNAGAHGSTSQSGVSLALPPQADPADAASSAVQSSHASVDLSKGHLSGDVDASVTMPWDARWAAQHPSPQPHRGASKRRARAAPAGKTHGAAASPPPSTIDATARRRQALPGSLDQVPERLSDVQPSVLHGRGVHRGGPAWLPQLAASPEDAWSPPDAIDGPWSPGDDARNSLVPRQQHPRHAADWPARHKPKKSSSEGHLAALLSPRNSVHGRLPPYDRPLSLHTPTVRERTAPGRDGTSSSSTLQRISRRVSPASSALAAASGTGRRSGVPGTWSGSWPQAPQSGLSNATGKSGEYMSIALPRCNSKALKQRKPWKPYEASHCENCAMRWLPRRFYQLRWLLMRNPLAWSIGRSTHTIGELLMLTLIVGQAVTVLVLWLANVDGFRTDVSTTGAL